MKVALCIPRYGDTKGEFTISLGRMLIHTARARPELDLEIFSAASSDLVLNRTRLLQAAMRWQARYCLWLDTDHVFPPDALLRLIGHQLECVGINQPRRTVPTGPVTMRRDAAGAMEHVWTTEALAKEGRVEEVEHVGLAFTLIDMLVFLKVRKHVERGVGWANWEPFERRVVPGTSLRMGEDASFMAELRAAGIAVHVDHGLSWRVGHIGERVFTNADTITDKDAWLRRAE